MTRAIVGAKPKRPCAHCGKPFTPKNHGGATQRYCGNDCFFAAQTARRHERERRARLLKCPHCGFDLLTKVKL